MEGGTSNNNDEIKNENAAADIKNENAEADVEPIAVGKCLSLVPAEQSPVPAEQSADQQGIFVYKECRRNHAASFGRYTFDGCGEFMCCNNDIFKCAACGCHRSFHRKDSANNNVNNETHPQPPAPVPAQPIPLRRVQILAPLPIASHNGRTPEAAIIIRDAINHIDAGSETLSGAEIEAEKITMKKRVRTMLTMEQKSKMARFADKLGWRVQRHDDAEIQQFCQELGITRRVFVVWLNNNRRRKDSI